MNLADTANSAALKPGVSVIVCCYNSSRTITPTIGALSVQKIPENAGFEVILVDNNCTDDTVSRARRAWTNPRFPLRVVREMKPGLMHARVTGLKSVHHRITLFVDDDNVLRTDWIAKLIRIYGENPRVGAVGGYNRATFPGEKPEWFDLVEGVYACGPRDSGPGLNPKKMFGAGLSFRTRALESALFSELPLFLVGRTGDDLSRGDDTEISLRLRLKGWDFYYDDSLVLHHNLPRNRLNWRYVCQARKRGGEVSLLLKFYRDLLNGRETLSYGDAVRLVCRKWKKFFADNKLNSIGIRKAGSGSSIRFYRLVGMTRGLLIWKSRYSGIRRQILNHFQIQEERKAGGSGGERLKD